MEAMLPVDVNQYFVGEFYFDVTKLVSPPPSKYIVRPVDNDWAEELAQSIMRSPFSDTITVPIIINFVIPGYKSDILSVMG